VSFQHSPHQAAGRVGRYDQDRIEVELLRGDSWQAAEQCIGGGNGAGKEYAEPAQVRSKEWVKKSGSGEREAENGIGAGIARQEAEAKYLSDHQHRNLHAVRRLQKSVLPLGRVQLQDEAGKER